MVNNRLSPQQDDLGCDGRKITLVWQLGIKPAQQHHHEWMLTRRSLERRKASSFSTFPRSNMTLLRLSFADSTADDRPADSTADDRPADSTADDRPADSTANDRPADSIADDCLVQQLVETIDAFS